MTDKHPICVFRPPPQVILQTKKEVSFTFLSPFCLYEGECCAHFGFYL